MRGVIVPDQIPRKMRDGSYLVRKQFHYGKPRNYSIEFCIPAIFASGCLTCG